MRQMAAEVTTGKKKNEKAKGKTVLPWYIGDSWDHWVPFVIFKATINY